MADRTGLALLRAVIAAAGPEDRPLYAPDRLRFSLETLAGDDAGAARESLRTRIAALVGTDRFALEPIFAGIDADGVLFLTFSPDGIDRTLPEDALFAIAADLRAELGLISAEPDTGAPVFPDPERAEAGGTEGAILDATCWVQGTAPMPETWALDTIRVPQAWTLAPGKGRGIVIAQPDTGVTDHAELADTVIDRTRTLNIVEGGTDPTDPLPPGAANPGHGTATGSVAASGERGKVVGSAPKATLVPIRCVNDVKLFQGTPVARAIDHAVSVGAHVITMSLGGLWFRAIRKAIGRAIARDTIVISAAGNCVGLVVWPAAYPEMIGIGGTNKADAKWKGSSTGRAVAISAPAEFVWRAERKSPADPPDRIGGGQGTSFATALTAGVAALWLERHGRQVAIAEARRRGVPLQELFRAALRQTARRPADFPSGLGAGIVDAEALLRLRLADIRLVRPESPGPAPVDPSGGIEEALTALLGPGQTDEGFDWAAHGAEVSALLLADARAGRGLPGGAPEARGSRRASAALTEAADAAADPRLAKLALRPRMPAPAVFVPVAPDPARTAQTIVRAAGGTEPVAMRTETTRTLGVEAARARLDPEGRRRLLDPVRARAERAGRPDLIGDLDRIDESLALLHRDGANARLGAMRAVQIEALVSLTERPALPVYERSLPGGGKVQSVDETHESLGSFQGLVALALGALEDGPLAAVGRIDGDGVHTGTGFVVGEGLVMTNRHVLEHLASPVPRRENPASWVLHSGATIDFSPGAFDPAQRFRITEVAFAGPNEIGELPIDFAKLDLALLRVETVNAAGRALPRALPVGKSDAWHGDRNKLYVVGFPAAPVFLPLDEAGEMRRDVIDRLRALFGLDYGRKFFSPGVVQAFGPGWTFDHDATTLGGNSGSLVGVLGGKLPAVGLHFAGDWLRANFAHDLAAVRRDTPALDALLG